MSPLSKAISSRRMGGEPSEQKPSKVTEILATLDDAEKMQLMDALKLEMGESEEASEEMGEGEEQSLEQKDGETKQTSGEKKALAEATSGGPNMEVAEALGGRSFDPERTPQNLSQRVQQNISKMMRR